MAHLETTILKAGILEMDLSSPPPVALTGNFLILSQSLFQIDVIWHTLFCSGRHHDRRIAL